jgi:hypothetical protein
MPFTDTVTLRGGVAVPLHALRVLWALEARRFYVRRDLDGTLLISQKSKLTPDDDQAIRAYTDEIKALVTYAEVM